MYVEVEVDIGDVISDMSSSDFRKLIEAGLEDGYIPEGWLKVSGEVGLERFLAEDPKMLLLMIEGLRKMGYTVEPGVQNAHSD